MPLGEMAGIGPGNPVTAMGRHLDVPVGIDLLGRVLDGLGRPIDGRGDIAETTPRRAANASPPDPLTRPRIHDRISLGVRALDSLVPCGQGQRLGIFAGSGVGKSSLMGMIARSTSADVNVICLVGERGREVREFIERDLGDAIERSVVIVATSDQPALVRIKAALTATTIAESFRDAGADVMLMMDSVTRFAMAQREVGLAIGEPPATRGYTPSVFALLPKLLERSGTSATGSITGLYTVLVDGDDMNEPIADAVRSILDGHIVLTRELAHAGHYPAIDVLQSVSRLTSEVLTPEVQTAGQRVRSLMAAYKDKKDLIAIGAYEPRLGPADRPGDRAPRPDRRLPAPARHGRVEREHGGHGAPAARGGRAATDRSPVAGGVGSRVRARPGRGGIAERDPAAAPVRLGVLLEAPQHGAHGEPDRDGHQHDQPEAQELVHLRQRGARDGAHDRHEDDDRGELDDLAAIPHAARGCQVGRASRRPSGLGRTVRLPGTWMRPRSASGSNVCASFANTTRTVPARSSRRA